MLVITVDLFELIGYILGGILLLGLGIVWLYCRICDKFRR